LASCVLAPAFGKDRTRHVGRFREWEMIFSPTSSSEGTFRDGVLFQREQAALRVRPKDPPALTSRGARFSGKILELGPQLKVATKTRHGPKGGGECEEPHT
jgi:hypothetical protein